MNTPTGYSALDFVGFTDRGAYSPSATYVKNDLVHHNNSIWKCKLDDTTGQTPAEGLYWESWVTSTTSIAGMTDADVNTPADGDVLIFNSETSKWENKPIAQVDGERITFGAV